MDTYSAIRILALKAVMRPDAEYFVRKTIRWYSKTFSTPIADVEQIPFDTVLQAYFEERYGEMSRDELDAERRELLVTEEERRKLITMEEEDEVDMWLMGRMEAKAREEAMLVVLKSM